MWPGSLVAKATFPAPPLARYSVIKSEPHAHTLERAEKTAAAAELRRGGEIDSARHPGKFTRDGDDTFFWRELNLEHRHCAPNDLVLHAADLEPSDN